MDWLKNLFFGSDVAHGIAVFSLAIALGVALGKLKIGGISLGITWVLFVGIALGHFGMSVEYGVLQFVKEFGLVLFVYSIGLQVGPSFFSSLKKTGLKMNMMAVGVVLLGVATAISIHFATGTPIPTMVGILSGAVTNTPGLGAAQQAYSDIMNGVSDESISLGYAVAYPLGVLGAIGVIILFRFAFRDNIKEELEKQGASDGKTHAHRISIEVKNPVLFGRTIGDILDLHGARFVISRVRREDGKIDIATPETEIKRGDKLLVVVDAENEKFVTTFIGDKTDCEWQKIQSGLEARRIMITNSRVAGKTLGKLGLFGGYSFNITRVNRAGIDLVAYADLELQMGDRVTVVGSSDSIGNVEKILGNSMLKLRMPNLIPIFLGIFLGVAVGSIPFTLPGIPQSVKLGLAGGPLVVAILIARYGTKFKLVPYTTVSANLMLREVGIALFLAGVGIGAGEKFWDTVVQGNGLVWIFYGAIITIVPLLIAGVVAKFFVKMDYFTFIGVISGSITNPPALAYSNSISGTMDKPSVAYSTVYPLSMFLRVMTAQLIIILFV